MLDRATPFRAYVVGSPENRKDFLELAGGIANDRIVFCFDDEEHHQSETTSGPNSASGNRPPEGAIDAQQLWDSTGFYCVLYLARNADIRDVKSEGLSAFLHRFESFTRQGVPTFLVPLDGPPSSTIRSEADGIARPVVSDLESRAENCSNTTTKLIHVEQLVHRLGGAGLVYPSDIPNLDVFLKNSLQTHYENEAILQDIRDAESYLQKLRQSELRYRNLVQMSRDLIWSVDVEGRWTFVNDAVINILGYTPKEMIGRRFTEFQDPKDASKDLVTFSKVLEGQKYFDYETCYLAKQGFRVVLSFNALVAFDEEGTPIGATGTAIDVTARKRAAEELKKQKEFFRQVVDANPNRIAVRNLAGQFVLANRAFANSLRYDADDLVGLKYDEIISEERALKLIARHDQQLIANPAQEIVFERRERSRHNGSGRWVQTTRKTLNISNHPDPFLLEVGVDLTERKRSEEALRHVIEGTAGVTAEEYFPSLLEHLAAALQMHAGIIYGTDEVEAHFRVLARFPDSLTYTDLQLPYDNPLFEKLLRENFILLTEGADEMMPAALRGHFSVLLGTILRDTRGESIGMLLVVGDNFNDNPDFAEYLLTLFGERASAELARIKNEKETKKLERQLQQAQKMEAIGTLAAGIAHDLNNALGAVAGHLQLLEGGPSISTEDKRSLHIALDGCSRASRLVHQLLGFSRRGNYVPERINLRELLSEMVEFLNCATRKDIDVAVSDVTDAFIVHADKNQFQQILMNLIINAQQAMPKGGTITVTAASTFVKLPQQYNADAAPGEYTVIKISDTGTGIDAAILDKIFEPFFTTKPAQMGTGLGLSMVYGIMQNHGGWVNVASSEGEGSTFELYFPRTVAAMKTSTEGQPLRKVSSQPVILVIDDEPFLVDLTCRFLERSGFRAKGFTDPIEALDFFERHVEDVYLTILDMKMPQLDGRSCFQRMLEIDPQAQVAVLSGYIQDDAARTIMQEGALRYFQKPLRYSELIDWVKDRFKSTASNAE